MRILMIGDVIGKLGRDVVRALMPDLKREKAIDFVICNGENTAGGYGITPDTASELLGSGLDVFTLGTHTHVRTVDAKIMPQGTAYLTDVGMTRPRDSVIGSDKDAVLERFFSS